MTLVVITCGSAGNLWLACVIDFITNICENQQKLCTWLLFDVIEVVGVVSNLSLM